MAWQPTQAQGPCRHMSPQVSGSQSVLPMVNLLSMRLYRSHWGSGDADATIPPRASLVLRVPDSYWIDCFMEAERFAQ